MFSSIMDVVLSFVELIFAMFSMLLASIILIGVVLAAPILLMWGMMTIYNFLF